MTKTLRVTASTSKRSIYMGKLQADLIVTCKKAKIYNKGIDYFYTSSFFTANNSKISEEKSIVCDCF